MKIQARARVQITIEMETSVWGGECQIEQVYQQAAREGKERVIQSMKGISFQVIGEPKIIGIITNREED